MTRLQTALPDAEVTMAETLREAGFATAAIGKMHFNSELMHGFDVRTDLREYDAWLARQARSQWARESPCSHRGAPSRIRAGVAQQSVSADGTGRRPDGRHIFRRAGGRVSDGRARSAIFLMVSFYEPHSPFRFPLEYAGRHEPAEFDVPALGPQDDDQIPAVFRDLTPREKQGIMAAYYTSVEFLDRNVGRALECSTGRGRPATRWSCT